MGADMAAAGPAVATAAPLVTVMAAMLASSRGRIREARAAVTAPVLIFTEPGRAK